MEILDTFIDSNQPNTERDISPSRREGYSRIETPFSLETSCSVGRGGVAASLLFLWVLTMLGLVLMKILSSPSTAIITTYFLSFWLVIQFVMIGIGPIIFNIESRILVTSALITLMIWNNDMLWIGILVAPMKIVEWCIFSDWPTKEEVIGNVTERMETR